jgi:uncharacterized peroxidase-related enzyme
VQHHGEGLLAEVGDRQWVESFKLDHRSVPLDEANRAMLGYVEKLTRTPARMNEQDIDALRAVGFEDRAILDINQITGFFAWCNRTVDGLGIQLEDYWDEATP